jgi:hypothetical protein
VFIGGLKTLSHGCTAALGEKPHNRECRAAMPLQNTSTDKRDYAFCRQLIVWPRGILWRAKIF